MLSLNVTLNNWSKAIVLMQSLKIENKKRVVEFILSLILNHPKNQHRVLIY